MSRFSCLLCVFALSLCVFGAPAKGTPGDILASLDAPGDHPTGLCFDGDQLWVADRFTDSLYAVDPSSGEIRHSLPAPGFIPRGLAFDGRDLWCVDAEEGRIHQISLPSGLTRKTIHCPTPSPQGLTWDGENLWLCDDREDVIARISTEDGTTVTTFRAPAGAPQGLAFDGRYLWCSDRGRDRIYMLETEGGEVLLSLEAPGEYARGLAWRDGRLWNVDYQDDRIHELVVDDGVPFKTSDCRRERLLLVHELRNYGPGNLENYEVYIAIPGDRPNQKLLSEPRFDPEPSAFPTDRWDQRYAHFHGESPPLAQRRLATMSVDAELHDTRWFVFPEKVGSLDDIPKDIRRRYLVDEDKYRIEDPIIVQAVDEALSGEERPYWIMRKIYRYLHEKLHYELSGGWNVAPAILARGNGSCSEYSFVFIAMCRAAGLPTRYVGSVAVRGDDASTDDVFHRWCECFLPGFGWVPVDPSGGDQDSPASVADYFGRVGNRFLITTVGGGASEFLGWGYNANETWTALGPVKVHVETLGEWSPLDEGGETLGEGQTTACELKR